MFELAHDTGFAQEVPPLLLGVTGFQRFNGHWDLSLPWQPQQTAAHLTELTCNREAEPSVNRGSKEPDNETPHCARRISLA